MAELLYAAIATRDDAGTRAVLADDVVLRVPGTHPLAGAHVGPGAVLAFVGASRDRTDAGEEIEIIDVLEGGDHLAVLCRVRATRVGRPPLDNRTVHVLRVEHGRIAEIWLHNFDDLSVNDFWS